MQEKFVSGIERLHRAATEAEELEKASVLEELAMDFGGTEVVDDVFEIQERKAAIMKELAADLARLDAEQVVGIEGKNRQVTYDGESDTLHYFGKGGSKEMLSQGQLMVAGMWGESYYLDETVPRHVKKRYMVQRTRYRLSDLYDHQIALYEAHQEYNEGTGLDEAYQAVAEHYKEGSEIPPGLLAEQMVESFLTKLTYDHGLPYVLKSVSVYEDVEYKIDFIIEPHEEGNEVLVGVREPESRPDIAIQFTTAQSELTVEHKKRQISQAKHRIEREDSMHIKDLVLIVLPISEVAETYQEWQRTKANKRRPGGPDELWDEATKQTIFKGVLDRVFSTEKTREMWRQVQGV